jgi:hypothetical protein
VVTPFLHGTARIATIAGVLAALLLAAPLRAQSVASGRIEGAIHDSIHAAPLSGASVLAIRAEPPSASGGATTDARGRFRIDSLPVGRYMVEFASAMLDSLEIMLPPREVTVVAGRAARVDFALPSGRTLRAAACPGLALPSQTGAVVGRVLDADTDRPLAGARVVVAWQDVVIDTATLSSSSVVERTGAVQTDSLGRYRLCGVPTDGWLLVQVQHEGRAGAGIRLLVPDSAGVAVQHLSLSASASSTVAAGVAPATDTTEPPPLTGDASVAGVIRGVGGLPLSGAQVRVIGAAGRATSDARGRFALGDLPAGTQVLEVRRIGYLLTQQPVELRAGRTAEQDVRLQRIVTLDSLRVLAQRSRYSEFEAHRKANAFGKFLTAAEVESRHPYETSDLFRFIPGFKVAGFGIDAKIVSSRGELIGRSCEPNIVIDGMPYQDINLINPANIGAIEAYRSGQPGPVMYDNGCGAIIIWSKR